MIVHEVHKDGVADKDGRIKPGDFIVSVDGKAFKDITNKDAIRALRIAKDKVSVPKMSQNQSNPTTFVFRLRLS